MTSRKERELRSGESRPYDIEQGGGPGGLISIKCESCVEWLPWHTKWANRDPRGPPARPKPWPLSPKSRHFRIEASYEPDLRPDLLQGVIGVGHNSTEGLSNDNLPGLLDSMNTLHSSNPANLVDSVGVYEGMYKSENLGVVPSFEGKGPIACRESDQKADVDKQIFRCSIFLASAIRN